MQFFLTVIRDVKMFKKLILLSFVSFIGLSSAQASNNWELNNNNVAQAAPADAFPEVQVLQTPTTKNAKALGSASMQLNLDAKSSHKIFTFVDNINKDLLGRDRAYPKLLATATANAPHLTLEIYKPKPTQGVSLSSAQTKFVKARLEAVANLLLQKSFVHNGCVKVFSNKFELIGKFIGGKREYYSLNGMDSISIDKLLKTQEELSEVILILNCGLMCRGEGNKGIVGHNIGGNGVLKDFQHVLLNGVEKEELKTEQWDRPLVHLTLMRLQGADNGPIGKQSVVEFFKAVCASKHSQGLVSEVRVLEPYQPDHQRYLSCDVLAMNPAQVKKNGEVQRKPEHFNVMDRMAKRAETDWAESPRAKVIFQSPDRVQVLNPVPAVVPARMPVVDNQEVIQEKILNARGEINRLGAHIKKQNADIERLQKHIKNKGPDNIAQTRIEAARKDIAEKEKKVERHNDFLLKYRTL
jgi:hypothetical protein